MMKLLQPWQDHIGKVNLVDIGFLSLQEIDALIEELMVNVALMNQPLGKSDISEDTTPKLHSVLHSYVKRQVEQYVKNCFGRFPTELRLESWAFLTSDGKGLEPHLHAGAALVTTALYLTDSVSDLVLIDPRGNALRGFPQDLRDANFGNFRIRPKAGDLVIFPCYMNHFVAAADPQLRLSVLSDCYFK